MESAEDMFLFGGELEGERYDCEGPAANDRFGGWRSRIIIIPNICCITVEAQTVLLVPSLKRPS